MPIKVYKREVDRKPGDKPKTQWSQKQKYEAVALWKMIGNLRAVGRSLGIPQETMYNWYQSDWWKEIADEIQQEASIKRGKKLDKLVDLATDIVEDRLTHGDYKYNPKTGKLVRMPVNAQVASKILDTGVSKQVMLENLARENKKVESDLKSEDRLRNLFEEFRKFNKAKTIEAVKDEGVIHQEVIEVQSEEDK